MEVGTSFAAGMIRHQPLYRKNLCLSLETVTAHHNYDVTSRILGSIQPIQDSLQDAFKELEEH